MLDKNTLSQLSKLKADIHASREFASGTVASTNGRFGFVRLEDGRDAFLSPEKMQRVLPGDIVKVELITNKNGKLEANLDKLISSHLKRFMATFRVKGKAQFVEPLDTHINRWVFVAPKNRNNAEENHVVLADIIQHPWKDGKAQAKVLDAIGTPDSAYYEYRFVCAKHALTRSPHKKIEQKIERECNDIISRIDSSDFGERDDLSSSHFVTIDSPSTRDMDDALCISKKEGGYLLQVAIADPSNFIDESTALAKRAEEKSQTLYLNGGILPMLPENLANTYFSLCAEATRPALVCNIDVSTDGSVNGFEFKKAIICSKHKLNYDDVSQWLSQENSDKDDIDETLLSQLRLLHALAKTRLAYRQDTMLVSEEQNDYQFLLDDHGKIADIVKREKNLAHQLVEECMLLINSCAGEFLAAHNCGLHTVHNGFRTDRLGEAKALLKEENIEAENVTELAGYTALIRSLASDENHGKLVAPLKRMSEMSLLHNSPGPHMGIGTAHYAAVSSPIRRYADLYNHWRIAEILAKQPPKTFDDTRLHSLNENIQCGRQADRELKQWLICDFANKNTGIEGKATIRIVTPQGFGARLEEQGIDGFVLIGKNTEKKFDAKRLCMSVGDESYYIGKTVNVKLTACDLQKKRITFTLSEAPSQ